MGSRTAVLLQAREQCGSTPSLPTPTAVQATAGLVPIEDVPGVENVNLSNLIEGHFGYLEHLEPIIMDMLML